MSDFQEKDLVTRRFGLNSNFRGAYEITDLLISIDLRKRNTELILRLSIISPCFKLSFLPEYSVTGKNGCQNPPVEPFPRFQKSSRLSFFLPCVVFCYTNKLWAIQHKKLLSSSNV